MENRSVSRPGQSLIFELLSGLYLLAVIIWSWRCTFLTGLALSLGVAVRLWRHKGKDEAAIMIFAGLLGPATEMVCVKLGVWTYRGPVLMWGVPVWLPLVWAFLFSLFRRLAFILLSGLESWSSEWPRAHGVLLVFLWALITVYSIVTLLVITKSIALVYGIFFLIFLVKWRRTGDLLVFIIAGIIGTTGEYIAIRLGFWVYHFPLIKSLGLPISLPMAWGLSAVILSRLAAIWDRSDKEKRSFGN